MARIRTVKPDFWLSETMTALPPLTRLLSLALLNYADDEGYFRANPKLVKSDCLPLDDSANILGMLDELSICGWIQLGAADDGTAVGRVINFLEHQRIDKPTKSKLAEKSITWHAVVKPSKSTQGSLLDASRLEGKGKEGKDNNTVELTLDGSPDSPKGKRAQAVLVLTYLNEKAKRRYESVPANIDLIVARIKEGATEEQCRAVIDNRVQKWGRDDKMEQYLRPKTLFNRTNFAQYAGEIKTPGPLPGTTGIPYWHNQPGLMQIMGDELGLDIRKLGPNEQIAAITGALTKRRAQEARA